MRGLMTDVAPTPDEMRGLVDRDLSATLHFDQTANVICEKRM
jgi:hypothetical protein